MIIFVQTIEGTIMDRLQKSFTHLLEKEFTVEKLAARILVQKLERLGVSVDKEKRKEIEVQIKNAMSNDLSDSLTLDLDIEDFTLTGLSKLEINPEDYRNFEDYIDKTLKEGISRFIAEISNGLIEELQKQPHAFLKVHHKNISPFDLKLSDYCRSPLHPLEQL